MAINWDKQILISSSTLNSVSMIGLNLCYAIKLIGHMTKRKIKHDNKII